MASSFADQGLRLYFRCARMWSMSACVHLPDVISIVRKAVMRVSFFFITFCDFMCHLNVEREGKKRGRIKTLMAT